MIDLSRVLPPHLFQHEPDAHPHTMYLEEPLGDHKGTVRKTVARIREVERWYPELKVEAIAFTGMSGAIIGSAVAGALGRKQILVRKPTGDAHSKMLVETGFTGYATTYAIVDDLVSSGDTVRRVVQAIYGSTPWMKPIGLYCYSECGPYTWGRYQFDSVPRVPVWLGDLFDHKTQWNGPSADLHVSHLSRLAKPANQTVQASVQGASDVVRSGGQSSHIPF